MLRTLPRDSDNERRCDLCRCFTPGARGKHRHNEAGRHTAHVGFDPTRKHRRSSFDYWYVAAGVLVCALLVVWALFG